MPDLTERGVRVDLPGGWDGEIYSRAPDGAPLLTSGPGETHHSVVHAASFPLPLTRGDFGSGAVEIMRTTDVLVILFEYHPDSASTALFRHDVPRSVDPDAFSTSMMQRPLDGQAGTQLFFSEAGRAFCLYVVLGSYANRHQLVPLVNDVLAGLRINPL